MPRKIEDQHAEHKGDLIGTLRPDICSECQEMVTPQLLAWISERIQMSYIPPGPCPERLTITSGVWNDVVLCRLRAGHTGDHEAGHARWTVQITPVIDPIPDPVPSAIEADEIEELRCRSKMAHSAHAWRGFVGGVAPGFVWCPGGAHV